MSNTRIGRIARLPKLTREEPPRRLEQDERELAAVPAARRTRPATPLLEEETPLTGQSSPLAHSRSN
jgi:hypothetical protein